MASDTSRSLYSFWNPQRSPSTRNGGAGRTVLADVSSSSMNLLVPTSLEKAPSSETWATGALPSQIVKSDPPPLDSPPSKKRKCLPIADDRSTPLRQSQYTARLQIKPSKLRSSYGHFFCRELGSSDSGSSQRRVVATGTVCDLILEVCI